MLENVINVLKNITSRYTKQFMYLKLLYIKENKKTIKIKKVFIKKDLDKTNEGWYK